ncbi:MAG: M48 family metallopeptidase [Methylococcaceae bacterium]|nr:M48 family metallopeptidase [Methylococcaceae bacterium]
MNRIDGLYFDGRVSRPTRVQLNFDSEGNLDLRARDFHREYAFGTLKFSPRIGNAQRDIFLPDGGKCETFANDEIDKLLIENRTGWFGRVVHALESHFVYGLASVLLTLGFGWSFVNYGIPAIAKEVAFALPLEADAALGRHALDVLDRLIFSESGLGREERDRLSGQFTSGLHGFDDPERIRLLFRNSVSLGANAIALPSGIVVITDQLVELADNDEEIAAILAHELGHVKHRHGLRTVLQSSVVVLVITWLTGDLSSLSALSAALPAQMIEAKYSRHFEREADQFAREYLIANRIPLRRFSDILSRIEAESPSGTGSMTFLASHPATEERIRLFSPEVSSKHAISNP